MRLKQSGEHRSEPGESLAPDRSRDKQAVSPRKEGCRPVAVELAIGGLVVELAVEPAGRAPIARGREAGRAVREPLTAPEARLEPAARKHERSTLIKRGTRLRRGPKAVIPPSGGHGGAGGGQSRPYSPLIDCGP
jgi:hypothetical protein